MFTGIIEELGEVVAIEPTGDSSRITVAGRIATSDATHGASIAVDGVCLTVTDPSPKGDRVTFDVIAESLRRSALGDLRVGDRVNLERAMVFGSRLDGHLVQGHVDAVATITERRPEGGAGDGEVVRLRIPADLAPFVVEKGSICLDGVSLTLTAVGREHVEVALIPTTMELTTLGHKAVGDRVNVEVDVIGKYVQRQLDLDQEDAR